MGLIAAITAALSAAWIASRALVAARLLPLLLFVPGAGSVVASGGNVLAAVIQFFSTTLGRYVLIGLVGLGLYVAGGMHRAKSLKAQHRVEIARMLADAEAKRKARDEEVAREVKADADERLASLAKMTKELQAELEKERAKIGKVGDVCRISPTRAKRLRKF